MKWRKKSSKTVSYSETPCHQTWTVNDIRTQSERKLKYKEYNVIQQEVFIHPAVK